MRGEKGTKDGRAATQWITSSRPNSQKEEERLRRSGTRQEGKTRANPTKGEGGEDEIGRKKERWGGRREDQGGGGGGGGGGRGGGGVKRAASQRFHGQGSDKKMTVRKWGRGGT